MAKAASSAPKNPNLLERIRDFFLDVKAEMSKVTWPSVDELKTSTQVVLMLLVLFGVVIYAYDFAFQVIVVKLLEVS